MLSFLNYITLRDIDFTYDSILPDAMRDAALRFTVDVGHYLLDKAR